MSVVPLLKKGDRCRVIAENAPPCREGTIMEVCYRHGRFVGYRVLHDESPWPEPGQLHSNLEELFPNGIFTGKRDFNWSPREVVPVREEIP